MPATLRDLRFDQAANLVDDPANPKARIVLFKRAVKKEAPAVGAVHVDRPDWLTKELAHFKPAEKAKEHHVTKQSFLKKLASDIVALFKSAEAGTLTDWASEEENEPEHAALKARCDKFAAALAAYGDGAGLAADHPLHALKALHKEMCDELAACSEKAAAARKEASAHKTEDEGDEAVHKQFTDVSKQVVDLQKKLEATEKRAVEAETIAKAERDARELETEKTTLRKFRHVAIDVDTEAATFLKLRHADKALYDAVVAKLNAAEAVAKQARVLEQEIGSPLSGNGATAWAEIEAEADKLVSKGEKGLTREKAIDRVMKARPELVTRYRAEQAGQVS